MKRKFYAAPNAEIEMFIPAEDLAAGWGWGIYKPESTASVPVGHTEDVWKETWDFSQSNESYKIEK